MISLAQTGGIIKKAAAGSDNFHYQRQQSAAQDPHAYRTFDPADFEEIFGGKGGNSDFFRGAFLVEVQGKSLVTGEVGSTINIHNPDRAKILSTRFNSRLTRLFMAQNGCLNGKMDEKLMLKYRQE